MFFNMIIYRDCYHTPEHTTSYVFSYNSKKIHIKYIEHYLHAIRLSYINNGESCSKCMSKLFTQT